MRTLTLGSAVALLAAASGCSEPTARVSGTVRHQGQPLAGATITFFPPNNRTFTADTGPDGTYSVTVTGRGTVRVSVQAPPPRPKPRPDPPAGVRGKDAGGKDAAAKDDKAKMARMPPASDMPPGVKIPDKYLNPSTSGLSFELTGADQVFDINIE
jgi:hypothetical protein